MNIALKMVNMFPIKKLWDEEAEQEEKELHEKELKKLEAWKKSVEAWNE